MKKIKLEDVALRIRDKIINTGYRLGVGHIGSCLSCVEIMVYLYYYRMKPNDIFILSKGHASLTLYCILNDLGIVPDELLWDYPSKLGIHPELDKSLCIYASTGSLGHGIGIGLGYAVGNKDVSVYVLLGDGETDEGSVYEALNIKNNLGVNNLIPIIDRNGFKGYDAIRMRAGLLDGHSFDEIDYGFDNKSSYPILEFKTIKGKGLERFEDDLGSHYWFINEKDINEYKKDLYR